MKTKQLFLSLIWGLGLTLALLWLLGSSTPPAHAGSPHYVAPDCTGVLAPCHTSIQEAVDAAVPGDEIRVATGTYTGVSARAGVTQVVYISKTVTIRGGYTTTNWTTYYPITQPTTLDAQGQGRVLYITGSISPTIEGLRITGGDATGLGGGFWPWMDAGGGVYIISATAAISNSWLYSNTTAWDGGGLYLSYGAATLSSNTVTVNTANRYGGGLLLYHSDATFISNTITTNTASDCGGLFLLGCNAAMLNGNVVTSNTAYSWGGGLCLEVSNATLSSNVVADNTAGSHGGGLHLSSSDATLNGNTVISNTAGWAGGGLFLAGSDATLINDVVADNHANTKGSGLYIIGSSPHLLHTTIVRNVSGEGSGVYVTGGGGFPSTVALTNTILVSHTVGITVEDGTVTVESTLWGSGAWANDTDWGGMGTIITGTRNYWGAPAFVNPDAGDYHIGLTSAAIDKGVDAGVDDDIDGDPRPQGSGYDLGADEFTAAAPDDHKIYLPLIMRQYPQVEGHF